MQPFQKKSKHRTGKVLVLGSETRSFLPVIRSLGRRNLSVHVGWCSPDSSALNSKYITAVHDIPAYSPHDDSWKAVLISILQAEEFDLVIPCNDPALISLQKHRTDLEPLACIALLNEQAREFAFNKFKVNELAKSLGINVPKEIKASHLSAAEAILSEFELPVVLKPRSTFSEENLLRRNAVSKVYNPEALSAALEILLEQGDVSVQENFIGTGVGVELLAAQGELLFAFQHVRVHEPIMGGGSSYRKSVPLDPELLEASTKLLKALSYTGVAMVEFKVDFETGAWVFIEINARFWGSLPLAVAAGADFPYYLYQLLVLGKRKFPQRYKAGIYCRNFLEDFSWMVQNVKADRSDRTLATLPLWKVGMEIFTILSRRERSDTFVTDDCKPGFAELNYFIGWLWRQVFDRIQSRLLILPLVRKLYARQARRALREAQTILFACKGNICRSPFAQCYAQTIFPSSVKIMSCGYYPKNGRACPSDAVKAAEEIGIDLTQHRSCIITREMVNQADVIFTFDEENRKTLMNHYPLAQQKIHRISLLASRVPLAIKDPYGGDVDAFKATYQTIMQVIDVNVID